jgi:hypothetical protein
MKRRTAIRRILLTGAIGVGAFSGYERYQWSKSPDFDYLEKQRPALSALVQTIIPPGHSIPGAADAGVHDFIIKLVKDCVTIHSANTFIDGLKDLVHYSSSHYDRPFEACSATQQTTILTHFQEKGRPLKGLLGKAQNRYLGKSFFSLLKEYTVMGYITSERGASNGMAYVAIPGAFHGCLPLTPGQRAWATK